MIGFFVLKYPKEVTELIEKSPARIHQVLHFFPSLLFFCMFFVLMIVCYSILSSEMALQIKKNKKN